MKNKDIIKQKAASLLTDKGEMEAAQYLAATLFADKVDKAGKPYIGHLERVANGVDDSIKPAAYLHDVLEDIEGWKKTDLLEIGFSARTVNLVEAVTKESETEPYFQAIERAAKTKEAIPLKRSDLKDNANLLRLDHLPQEKDYERVKKYFIADKYLESVEKEGFVTFESWTQKQSATLLDMALIAKETAPKSPLSMTSSAPFSPK
jgi:hypothetical protein